ncbi:MAG: phosphotransferase [Acidimicrobiales bacterium]
MRTAIVPAREMTTEWLTDVLADAGIGGGAAITDMKLTSIGTGQVGENVRFVLTWSSDDPELPATVVGKFPSQSEISRSTAALTGTYVHEVGFYRDLASTVSMCVPTVHYVAGDPEANDFVLIMQDIRGAVQGDQLAGCTVEQAELAVDQAAALHGPTWGAAERLAELDWIIPPTLDRVQGRADLYAMVFDGFATRYATALSADDIELGRAMSDKIMLLAEASLSDDGDPAHALCLAHNDYRLDNMLFGVEPGAAPLTIVDWQTVSLGSGPTDLAYMLGSGLLPETRVEHDERLVRRYVDGLAGHGVDVSFDSIWHRYVLGAFSGYLMAVTASQIVEQTERGDAMFVAMASRHAEQMRQIGFHDHLGI